MARLRTSSAAAEDAVRTRQRARLAPVTVTFRWRLAPGIPAVDILFARISSRQLRLRLGWLQEIHRLYHPIVCAAGNLDIHHFGAAENRFRRRSKFSKDPDSPPLAATPIE